MERVAFLVESTGERIPCLLNPDSVVFRRRAGIRAAANGPVRITAAGSSDEPLLFTGGGRTELELELLFDTSLLPGPAGGQQAAAEPPAPMLSEPQPAPAPPVATAAPDIDVRGLTGPLWRLAENAAQPGGFGSPPLARFVWGRSWNVLGVVSAIAERVEQFDPEGRPARSWLRVRMLRVPEPHPEAPAPAPPPAMLDGAATAAVAAASARSAASGRSAPAEEAVHEVLGDGGAQTRGERLDVIAARYYPGQPWMWRFLAVVNALPDAPWVPAGAVLRIPPAPALAAAGPARDGGGP
jgi:hypothetical protein